MTDLFNHYQTYVKSESKTASYVQVKATKIKQNDNKKESKMIIKLQRN